MIYTSSYIVCQKCQKQAIRYIADVHTRAVKLPYRILMVVLLCVMWGAVYWLGQLPTIIFPLESFVTLLVVTIGLSVAAFLLWLLSIVRKRPATVVFCQHCGAQYALTQYPEYLNGWNLDKFAKDLTKKP